MYENIIAIHNVLKKKNYIVKFSTSSIFKKISKDNFEKIIKKRKKKKKSILGKKKRKKKTCKIKKGRNKSKKKKLLQKKKRRKKKRYSEKPTRFRVFY
jgi:hypothetical protein